ncbi:DUF3180 domain-containing protein [Nesterenkonia sp. Act20]|uniref:DUF3180 domain-containing protein n=1 Tax=Nesterenkonia sp. Act20 TaxID=1483432 RepID=UPI001C47869E|nr:DUF3180 domain-containing protein [Nesterenkonia sp. Act20]
MSRLRPVWLLIICAAAALGGLFATMLMASAGLGSPVLPRTSLITLLGIAAIILTLGLLVYRDQRQIARAAEQGLRAPRAPRRLHPLQAVRVVAAGQAGAYAGALIAGWHAGVLMDLMPSVSLTAPTVISSLLMITGGAIWVIIGFVVELLCRIPPDENSPEGDRAKSRGPRRSTGPIPEEGYARGTH